MNTYASDHAELEQATTSKSRLLNFVFTSFDPEAKPEEYYATLHWVFIAYQHEVCPTTGKLHIQGFCQLAKQHTFNVVKKCNTSNYLARLRGTAQQAYDYVTKQDTRSPDHTPQEFGEMRIDGRPVRGLNMTDQFLLQVREGTFNANESPQHQLFYAKHQSQIRAMERLRLESTLPATFDNTKVFIHWGVPGSGKSYNAHYGIYDADNNLTGFMTPDQAIRHTYEVTMYQPETGTPWFDGYTDQQRIVINEFGRGKFKYTDLLNITDRIAANFQAKGTSVQRRWTEIHLTSNFCPQQWYSGWKPPIEQGPFLRRVTKVIRYDTPHSTQIKRTNLTFADLESSAS